ncbi:MAG TPA: alpha-L-rhamnosidase C-terminal domain-containing protein [Opitutaceae bacterium]|nr:alpha-L-rhamnosidase C-terminal domain-containing protein [Opitutaceae bacterium]
MYGVVAGIAVDSAAPGYKHVLIAPQPGGGLTFVRASEQSPYGEIAVAWEISGGRFTLDVRLPANTSATVRLPAASLDTATESGRPLAQAPGVADPRQDGRAVTVKLGSGVYHFSYPAAPFPTDG